MHGRNEKGSSSRKKIKSAEKAKKSDTSGDASVKIPSLIPEGTTTKSDID